MPGGDEAQNLCSVHFVIATISHISPPVNILSGIMSVITADGITPSETRRPASVRPI
jgi:hypothetical protein